MIANEVPLEDLKSLPTILSFQRAYSMCGYSRPFAYKLVQEGKFPVPVHRVGKRYRVPTAPLLRYLGVDDSDHGPHTQAPASSGEPGNSSVVRTKSGKVIQAGKPYRMKGRVWDGSDIITVAKLLGIAS